MSVHLDDTVPGDLWGWGERAAPKLSPTQGWVFLWPSVCAALDPAESWGGLGCRGDYSPQHPISFASA